MKKLVFAFLLSSLLLAGCGHYQAHVYGASGKQYTAPEVCQAVAACNAAAESQCFYPHGETFSCSDPKK